MTETAQPQSIDFAQLWQRLRTPWTLTILIVASFFVIQGLPQFGQPLAEPGAHFGPFATWLTATLGVSLHHGLELFLFSLEALLGTLPFILFAVLLIAWLKASGAEAIIARAFQGNQVQMIFAAALIGGLAPFCSCEVIPFIAGLLALRVPLAPIMAFWLASPLIDPPTLAITAGALDWNFAIGKAVGAVFLGLFGGFAMKFAVDAGLFADPLKEYKSGGCGCGPSPFEGSARWQFWREAPRRQLFAAEAQSNLLFLLKWLAFAYALEAPLVFYLPAEVIAQVVGGEGLGPIIIGALVGMPAYLNSYAAPPLVAGLMDQGMSHGAAMSFLMAGAVSSIPAATAVWSLVKPGVFASYVLLGLSGAVIVGVVFQTVV